MLLVQLTDPCSLSARPRTTFALPQSWKKSAVQRKPLRRLSAMASGAAAPCLALSNGSLATSDGHVLLREFSTDAVSFRPVDGPLNGLVLGLHHDQEVSTYDAALGKLSCTRFLAASRVKLWWMIPSWGKHSSEVPPETQFLLLELAAGGPYAILLPLISGGTFRATLRMASGRDGVSVRVESGDAAVRASSWTDETSPHALLIAVGADPFQLVEEAVVAAASLSGGAPALRDKYIPASADVFGWCTWDAFYSDVSAKGIVEGLEALKEAGAPPQLLIIDDGWQLTEVDGGVAAPAAGGDATAAWQGGWWGRLSAAAFSMAGALVDKLVQWPGGPGLVQALLATPLRGVMARHYAATSDHARRLTSVEANAKFSSLNAGADMPCTSRKADLGAVVAQLKERFAPLRYVVCWHAMHGYWAGVSPKLHGAVVKTPQPVPGIVEVDPSIVWNPQTLTGIGLVDDISKLHRDMHGYLAGCGVDGVKVDVQGSSGMFGGDSGGGPRLSAAYHRSLEASVADAFPGNTTINCMAHSTENLYRTTATAVTRASDDFYPREAASHTVHLGICAFNALFIGPLLLPDWDMFHSRHPRAELHAAARAASGGPVYVSDAPGAHEGALLRRLVLPDGSVLRAALPARPTADTLFSDVLRDCCSLLKVWNMNRVNGLLFLANIQGASWDRWRHGFVTHDAAPPPLAGTLRPHDVPVLAAQAQKREEDGDVLPAPRYAVYSDRMRRLSVMQGDEDLEVSLSAAECDILVVAPALRCGDAWAAPIGLTNMLNAGGAVTFSSVLVAAGGGGGGDGGSNGTAELHLRLRGAGDGLLYADRAPAEAALDGVGLAFEFSPQDGAVRFAVPATPDLVHDIVFKF